MISDHAKDILDNFGALPFFLAGGSGVDLGLLFQLWTFNFGGFLAYVGLSLDSFNHIVIVFIIVITDN